MRLVRQEHDHGCGIAALAMVAELTYQEVYDDLVAHWPDAQSKGYVTEHGIHANIVEWYLARHDACWRYQYVGWGWTPWPPAPFAPAHIAQVRQLSGGYHFVAVTAEGVVLDPLDDRPRALTDWPQVLNVLGIWWSAPSGVR